MELKSYFPTPVEVVEMMCEQVHISINHKTPRIHVLEPQAGTGNILDYVRDNSFSLVKNWLDSKSYYYDIALKLYAIEIERERQMILMEKGYTVLDSDFLEFSSLRRFDVILSNPPFEDGDLHALQAWNYLTPGGVAVVLLNSETISNPHTKTRQLLAKIVHEYGKVKPLGQCFLQSENPTNVAVTMIVLCKPKTDGNDSVFDQWEGEKLEIPSVDAFYSNSIVKRNFISALVSHYHNCQKLVMEFVVKKKQLTYFLSEYSNIFSGEHSVVNFLKKCDDEVTAQELLNEMFWRYFFAQCDLTRKFTSQLQTQFDAYVKKQGYMAFSEINIYNALSLIFDNQSQIITNAAIQVWDMCCSFHKDNKVWTEGWVTNKSWRLNYKIIIPHAIKWCDTLGFSLTYHIVDNLLDIDKILASLAGRSFDRISTIYDVLYECFNFSNRRQHKVILQSTFFSIKYHKKGTLHLTIKDEFRYLIDAWNCLVAKERAWLGDGS